MERLRGLVTWIERFTKRKINRYNAENRILKFLDKGNLPTAPRHETFDKIADQVLREKPYLKNEFKELHRKDEDLAEHLKKVYLTSTSEVTGTDSKRPKLNKDLRPLPRMFYEPEKPTEGHCSFTHILEILQKYQGDSNYWNASALARHYNLDKKSVVNFLMYYSLFWNDKFQYMNMEAQDTDEDRKEVIEFEALPSPAQQIESKKE